VDRRHVPGAPRREMTAPMLAIDDVTGGRA
jgi:hypothetical protein